MTIATRRSFSPGQIIFTLRLLVMFSLLWWILADNAGWELGAIAVVIATVTGLLLAGSPTRWSVWGLCRFILYFLKESWLGGLDVSRRAFRTQLPLQPEWVDYPTRLPPGAPQFLFVTTMTLLPGTLGAELYEGGVRVHVLDPTMIDGLHMLEQRVAGVFAISLAQLSELTYD